MIKILILEFLVLDFTSSSLTYFALILVIVLRVLLRFFFFLEMNIILIQHLLKVYSSPSSLVSLLGNSYI